MPEITSRAGAVTAFAVSGLSFAAYPILRPWGPETGLEGARAFASTAWPLAHALGMVGFVALAVGLRSLASADTGPWAARSVRRTETVAWLAAALVLPFYGGEAFALQAVGAYVMRDGDAGALAIVDSFRNGPLALSTFAIGLLLLGVVGVRMVLGLWHAGTKGRVGGLLVAAGLVTYLPQFFGTPTVRVGHGLVLGLGLLLLAITAAGWRSASHPEAAGRTPSGPRQGVLLW